MKKLSIGIKETDVILIKRDGNNTSSIIIDPTEIHFLEWDLSGIDLLDKNKKKIKRIHLQGFGISEICETSSLLNLSLYKMRHREFTISDDLRIIKRKQFSISFLYKLKKFLHFKFCV